MMIQSLRQKWKQYLKKWSLWSPFVSLWLGSCFRNFSGFSYFFPGLFRLFRWDWVAVLGISAISATFSLAFSGCFAGFGQLFQEFQQFQLLFSRIFSCFWAGLGCCFRCFMDYSYPRPACYQPMAIVHYVNLVWGILC